VGLRDFFRLECRGGNMNSAQRSNFLVSARTNKRHYTCASSRALQCFLLRCGGQRGNRVVLHAGRCRQFRVAPGGSPRTTQASVLPDCASLRPGRGGCENHIQRHQTVTSNCAGALTTDDINTAQRSGVHGHAPTCSAGELHVRNSGSGASVASVTIQ